MVSIILLILVLLNVCVMVWKFLSGKDMVLNVWFGEMFWLKCVWGIVICWFFWCWEWIVFCVREGVMLMVLCVRVMGEDILLIVVCVSIFGIEGVVIVVGCFFDGGMIGGFLGFRFIIENRNFCVDVLLIVVWCILVIRLKEFLGIFFILLSFLIM